MPGKKLRFITLVFFVLLAFFVPASNAQVSHVINQVGFTFVPDDLTIAVGDTVRWKHSSGTHTVTSGVDSAAPDVGAIFDAPLSLAAPLVVHVFDQAGDVSYFCRPHELFDMKGIVRVELDATAVPTLSSLRLQVQSIQPNPFNPRASVRFVLGAVGPVSITVHDARGRVVRRLMEAHSMDEGPQRVIWDGRDDQDSPVPSGVYYFRISALGEELSAKGVLVR